MIPRTNDKFKEMMTLGTNSRKYSLFVDFMGWDLGGNLLRTKESN